MKSVHRPRLRSIPSENIVSSLAVGRKEPDFASLAALVASILRFGLLSPVVVRPVGKNRYELVCGSRRLSAAKLAGLDPVPCLVIKAKSDVCAAMSAAENLQRLDLDFVEEAEGYLRLKEMGYSPERAAEVTGVSPGRVSRGLACLNLPKTYLEKMRSNKLTARHALALSVLDGEKFTYAFDRVLRFGMDGSAAEKYAALLLARPLEKAPPPVILRDVRPFLNTVERGVDALRRSGMAVEYSKKQREEGLILTVFLPKND